MKRSFAGAVGMRRVNDHPGFRASEPIRSIGDLDASVLRRVVDDPLGPDATDLELVADFADFMYGDVAFDDGDLMPPDPVFRDRLRRRLWRTHVHTRLRDSRELH